MSVPPRSVFAAVARGEVDRHDEWDKPHCFQTLHWDGENLVPRMYVCIMTDVSPPDYPRVMAKYAAEQQQKDPVDPAYAYLLQIESFGVSEPGPDAPAAERAAFDDARRNRTFHLMPGATEACIVWVADIHGRLWSAAKTRQQPEHVHEVFYRPGRAPGGSSIRGLLAVAQLAGVAYHGIPGTWPGGPG